MLKSKLIYFKLNEAGHSEETLNHINLVEERILVESSHINNGLLHLKNHI